MPTNESVEFPGISEPYMKSGKGQEYIWKAHEIQRLRERRTQKTKESLKYLRSGRQAGKDQRLRWCFGSHSCIRRSFTSLRSSWRQSENLSPLPTSVPSLNHTVGVPSGYKSTRTRQIPWATVKKHWLHFPFLFQVLWHLFVTSDILTGFLFQSITRLLAKSSFHLLVLVTCGPFGMLHLLCFWLQNIPSSISFHLSSNPGQLDSSVLPGQVTHF